MKGLEKIVNLINKIFGCITKNKDEVEDILDDIQEVV